MTLDIDYWSGWLFGVAFTLVAQWLVSRLLPRKRSTPSVVDPDWEGLIGKTPAPPPHATPPAAGDGVKR